MRRICYYFFGFVKVKLSGCNVFRFINLCSKADITFHEVTKEKEYYLAKMNVSDFYKVKHFCRKTNVKIRILEKYGFPFWFQRRRNRVCFMGMSFLIGILILLYQFRIWNITILGNTKLGDEQILLFLQEHDVAIGSSKDSVNAHELEKAMEKQFPEIIWSSISIDGTKVLVQIKEDSHQQYQLSEEPGSILAKENGKVLSIYVCKGTACVKAGDEFKKGDILVRGSYDLFGDDNEIKGTVEVKAKAILSLLYSFEVEESFDSKEKAMDWLLNYFSKLEENGCRIVHKNVIVKQMDNGYQATGTVEVSDTIGEEQKNEFN